MNLGRLLRRPIGIDNGNGPPRYPVKEALARVRRLIYRGNKRECSCCGGTFSLFLFSPYMSALCPNCLSTERYRLLCRYLRDETDFGSREVSLLDIAPTWSFQEFCRSYENVEYLSVDIASPLAMHLMDITDIDFNDSRFDRIICYHVLEHVDEDMKALRELCRVLKPGGWAIIQVPIAVEKTVERSELTEEEAENLLRFDDHRRAYGKDFAELLESAGFIVEVVPFVKRFTTEEIKRYGLDETEDLYLCRK
ncbi:MAG: methyltransferase domain-containing protein [Actinomycetia bacterium]|nr:methyltransferase domain-containing protein [Actinomycetes bacterium]